jgi:hypothetical protein
MLETIERESRVERALIRTLFCTAGFLPAAALLALARAAMMQDPKFGFAGSATLIFYLMVIPFAGFIVAIALFSWRSVGPSARSRVAFGSVFALLAFAREFMLSSVIDLSVLSSVIVAVGSGALTAVIFELSATARSRSSAG